MMERIMTSLVKLSTSRQFQCTNCNFSGKIKKVEGFAIKLCHKHEDFIWHLPFKIDFFCYHQFNDCFLLGILQDELSVGLNLIFPKLWRKKKSKFPNILYFTQNRRTWAESLPKPYCELLSLNQISNLANSNMVGFGPSLDVL